jgi:serine/threonine protein kinase
MTMTGTMELKGNVRYMAPELFKPQAADMKHKFHTKESDVWAFGMVIYVRARFHSGMRIMR